MTHEPTWQQATAEEMWDYVKTQLADANAATARGDYMVAGQHYRAAFLVASFYAATLGSDMPGPVYGFDVDAGVDLDEDEEL